MKLFPKQHKFTPKSYYHFDKKKKKMIRTHGIELTEGESYYLLHHNLNRVMAQKDLHYRIAMEDLQ